MGKARKLITHSARNGFLYTMERNNGQTLLAKPYIDNINWTGHRPENRPAGRLRCRQGLQLYSGEAAPTPVHSTKRMCPGAVRRQQFLAGRLQSEDPAHLHPDLNACVVVTQDPVLSNKASDWKGGVQGVERSESDFIVADPFTGEVKKKVHTPYPNYWGTLSTAGGLVFTGYTDGTFAAYDDTTLDQLWKINVGQASTRRR